MGWVNDMLIGIMPESAAPSLDQFIDLSAVLGSGVYALFFVGELVYIGKAKRLLARIYAHRNMLERKRAGVRGVKAVPFSKVKVWPCKEIDLDRLEKELIERFQPKHNSNHIRPRPLARSLTLNINGFEIALGGISAKPKPFERRF